MLSESNKKLIRSLSSKKFRQKHNLFIAETDKVIHEFLLEGFKPKWHFSTDQLDNVALKQNAFIIKAHQMNSISQLQHASNSLAVFIKPETSPFKKLNFTLFLDAIRDPGNLGTIIRIADWYGIEQIYCSNDTVDSYNPKVVQASMGSLARVQCVDTELLSLKNKGMNIVGSSMQGELLYDFKKPKNMVLVIGNEGKGISENSQNLLDSTVSIPKIGKAESLNAAVATAIMIDRLLN